MSVQVRFYTIFGKYESFENQLRELVSRLRNEIKLRGREPEKLNLTMIKIKEEVLDTILKYVREEAQPPDHLRSLIEYMKSDNVTTLPTLVINGKKVAEGSLPDIKAVEEMIIDELQRTAGINLREPVKIPEEKPAETKPAPAEATVEEKAITAVTAPTASATIETTAQAAQAPTQQVAMPQPQVTQPQVSTVPPVSPSPPVHPSTMSTTQTYTPPETRPPSTETREARIETVPAYYARGAPSNCAECVYYGFNTRYCFLLGKKVDDITRPPCTRESL